MRDCMVVRQTRCRVQTNSSFLISSSTSFSSFLVSLFGLHNFMQLSNFVVSYCIRTTMMRFSVLICLSGLIFSTSAKPYRPREKEFGKAVQDTIVFDHRNGKMIQGMKEEVEPPQDMDITNSDINPNMLIWKAVKEEIQQKYNRPEEDKDALYHSFDIKHPADPKQHENYFQPLRRDQVQMYDKPEEDRDDLYHGMFDVAVEPMRGEKDVIGGNARPIYTSPEEDKDDLYHADLKGHQSDQQALAMNIFPIHTKRVHTEPEVDLDDLYHKL